MLRKQQKTRDASQPRFAPRDVPHPVAHSVSRLDSRNDFQPVYQGLCVEVLVSYSNQTSVPFVFSKFTMALQLTERKTLPEQDKRRPKQKQTRITKDHTQELIQRYQAGETIYELSDAYGINRRTVSIILKREGIATRHRKLSDDDITDAIELYESGRSLVDVGAELNVNAGTILNHLKRRGIARRQVGSNQWS